MSAPLHPLSRPVLVLGSTSPYRRELLARLRLPFTVVRPDIDESPQDAESPAALSTRLALAKAQDAARRVAAADAVVIGSDQVADLHGEPIGKPGTHERAVAQLRRMRAQAVVFHTAVSVVRPATGYARTVRVPVTVRFRDLSDAEIDTYLRTEQPYDCAGSAKCETLGIALLAAIESNDPTALVGLPLIATCELLREAGIDPLRRAEPAE
jgi:septum formation protein